MKQNMLCIQPRLDVKQITSFRNQKLSSHVQWDNVLRIRRNIMTDHNLTDFDMITPSVLQRIKKIFK